jgi:hypothetical protein
MCTWAADGGIAGEPHHSGQRPLDPASVASFERRISSTRRAWPVSNACSRAPGEVPDEHVNADLAKPRIGFLPFSTPNAYLIPDIYQHVPFLSKIEGRP